MGTLLQLSLPWNVVIRRYIHRTNLVIGVVLLTWLINFHGLCGFGWIAYIILSEIVIYLLLMECIVIMFWITRASYESTNLSDRLPHRYGIYYLIGAIIYSLSVVTSVSLTIAYDNYRFSLIRHVAGGVVLILTIVITTTLLSKLKGMLQNLNTSFGHLAEEEGYPHNVVQINQIKRTLASIILAGFGTLLGLVFFSFQSATSKNRSYSKRIHEEREHYNLYSDLIGYWLVLVAYFFMVYYTWMPMENSSCCSVCSDISTE